MHLLEQNRSLLCNLHEVGEATDTLVRVTGGVWDTVRSDLPNLRAVLLNSTVARELCRAGNIIDGNASPLILISVGLISSLLSLKV